MGEEVGKGLDLTDYEAVFFGWDFATSARVEERKRRVEQGEIRSAVFNDLSDYSLDQQRRYLSVVGMQVQERQEKLLSELAIVKRRNAYQLSLLLSGEAEAYYQWYQAIKSAGERIGTIFSRAKKPPTHQALYHNVEPVKKRRKAIPAEAVAILDLSAPGYRAIILDSQ